jgi:hypothetical protein
MLGRVPWWRKNLTPLRTFGLSPDTKIASRSRRRNSGTYQFVGLAREAPPTDWPAFGGEEQAWMTTRRVLDLRSATVKVKVIEEP